jgi:Dyp-type peroxidase family
VIRKYLVTRRYRVDRRDIQGNILCGYGASFNCGLYLFVRINDGAAGRRWLRELAPRVTTAESWPDKDTVNHTLNVALTYPGLERLGVPEPVLTTFPDDFVNGMAKRAKQLGDVEASAPGEWQAGISSAHAVVIVTARTREAVDGAEEDLRAQIAGHGPALEVTYAQHAGPIPSASAPRYEEDENENEDKSSYTREHFGFADGFSQPAIKGNAGPSTKKGMGTPGRFGTWWRVAPGEFVLGVRGADKLFPDAPVSPIGLGGSFMVLRKLHQNVPAYRTYLRELAMRNIPLLEGDPPDEEDPEREQKLAERQRIVAAKIMGRWHDGRSLVSASKPPPNSELSDAGRKKINEFRYLRSFPLWRKSDKDGYACPLGAHVRRANPRDAMGFQGRLSKRHRIIRRGMPYGPAAFDPNVADHRPNGLFDPNVKDADRGLMFVCYQASIARQFEVIQSQWLKSGDAFWLGADTDSLSMTTGMTIPGKQSPTFLPKSPEPFVTTRGGGYFFAPGMSALRALAAGYWR